MSQALKAVEGVVVAEVSLKDKRAEVGYNPEAVTTEKLVQAVNDAGFRASLVVEDEAAEVEPSF